MRMLRGSTLGHSLGHRPTLVLGMAVLLALVRLAVALELLPPLGLWGGRHPAPWGDPRGDV
ncbi:hypothetical protein [Meiothermus taiwanensis]|uniref:hypothetical protein n=1 Tax=Meiothermus taiwanensis TaxID=172827 RepID=UPI001CBC3A0A|nr:hypothetical protein [Meiothermus taiwanensis]